MNRNLWFRFIWLAILLWAISSVRSSAQVATSIIPPASTNLFGSSVTLSVVTDQDLPFIYQWSKDGVVLVDDFQTTGSTSKQLTISSLTFTNTGVYHISLTYTGVVVGAASAPVYVVDQPVLQSVIPVTTGAGISFIATAIGGLLSYQWTWQGQPIDGATGSALVFPNAYSDASAGYYSVNITNPIGFTNYSGPRFLFTKPTPSGTYQGIFFDTNSAALESSGFFQYTLAATKRSFSGKILIGASTYPFSGVFSSAHDSQFEVHRPNQTPLSVQLQLVTTNDSAQVFGLISDGTWSAFLRGNRLYFSARVPTILASKYTLSLLNTNIEPLSPSGSGYGTVNIRSNGTVVLTGRAADGATISQTCGLSRTGDWPFYISMYKGRGRLIGWLNVSRQNPNNIRGDSVAWIKGPGPDKLYPDGFSVMTQPIGSTYNRSNTIFGFTNAVATFSGGDLFVNNEPVWDFVRVLIPRPTVFSAEQSGENLRLSLENSSGIVSGQLVDVISGAKASIKGVVLQRQAQARGYFVTTNASGSFTLTAGTPPR